MARPRTLCLAEPDKPPKAKCKRGHYLREVGWSLHRFWRNGIAYTARRCKKCLLDDVQRCQRANAPKPSPKQQKLILAIKAREGQRVRAKDLARDMGISAIAVYSRRQRLQEKGLLRRMWGVK